MEIEKAVLVLALQDEKLEYISLEQLTPELFPLYGELARPVLDYRRQGKPYELDLIKHELGDKWYKDCYLFHGSRIAYNDYLKVLVERYHSYKILNSVHDCKVDKEVLQNALDALSDNTKGIKDTYDLDSDLQDYIKELEDRITGNIEWYPWNIDFMDEELGKLRMGKFFILKGMRKFGKTTLACKIFSSFIQRKIPTIFISTEMGFFEIMDKLVSLNTQINSFNIQQGKLSRDEIAQITKILAEKISYKPGMIKVCTRLTMDYIKDQIDRTGAKLIIIDFVQMLQIKEIPSGMNHAQILEEMATSLKCLCLEKQVSLIGLSQVSGADGFTKNCKAFEEKADTILWLHERKNGAETPTNKEICFNVLNRNGNSGVINIIYKKQYGDFLKDNIETQTEKKPYGED